MEIAVFHDWLNPGLGVNTIDAKLLRHVCAGVLRNGVGLCRCVKGEGCVCMHSWDSSQVDNVR